MERLANPVAPQRYEYFVLNKRLRRGCLSSTIASPDRGVMSGCDWVSCLFLFGLLFIFVSLFEFEEMPGCWNIGGKRES